jgi:hypothetical protein
VFACNTSLGVFWLSTQVGLPMLMLVRDLVLQLHREDEDAEAVVLVFLPTYKTLELLHRLLTEMAQRGTPEGDAAARCGSSAGLLVGKEWALVTLH